MTIKSPVIMKLETACNLGIFHKRFFKISGHVTKFAGLFEPGNGEKVYGVFKILSGSGERKEKKYHFNGVTLTQEVDFIAIPAEADITIMDGDGSSLLPHIIKWEEKCSG